LCFAYKELARELEHSIVTRDRRLDPHQVLVEVAEIVPRRRIVRAELDGPLEVGHGVVGLPQLFARYAQAVVKGRF
jgi:hypothetical protein